MSESNFSVWLFRPKGWAEGQAGERVAFPFSEPAEAADQAEAVLRQNGIPGQSYCELRFNGDDAPHTVICYMGKEEFGIWNTELSKWPIFYPPESGPNAAALMLDEFPFKDLEDGNSWKPKEDDDSDEGAEDGEIQEDDFTPDEDGDEEDTSNAEDGDDEGEEEDDEDADEEDAQDDAEEDAEEDFSDEAEDGENENDIEEEVEMPRLRIFAKLRGPLGWRKRAEAEELQEKNVFGLRLGIVDEDAETTGKQEREIFAQVQFVETDANRTGGKLRLKLPTLPEGVEFSNAPGGWIEAVIPYRKEEEA